MPPSSGASVAAPSAKRTCSRIGAMSNGCCCACARSDVSIGSPWPPPSEAPPGGAPSSASACTWPTCCARPRWNAERVRRRLAGVESRPARSSSARRSSRDERNCSKDMKMAANGLSRLFDSGCGTGRTRYAGTPTSKAPSSYTSEQPGADVSTTVAFCQWACSPAAAAASVATSPCTRQSTGKRSLPSSPSSLAAVGCSTSMSTITWLCSRARSVSASCFVCRRATAAMPFSRSLSATERSNCAPPRSQPRSRQP
mmetsp:Transcript_53685/g.141279  ORF Transcript_53685/g.141279 Transcript_53685/m.141279 type:complete len:256 (+) Transcript_53685:414-1181(+)